MPELCAKRRFTGVHSARQAYRQAGFRIRTYKCDKCRGYHVTNDEKHGRARDRRDQR